MFFVTAIFLTECSRVGSPISPEGYETWHLHNWLVTTTNHLTPQLVNYLEHQRVSVIDLNITAPGTPLTNKTMCFPTTSTRNNIPIDYRKRWNRNWNGKVFYGKYILVRTDNSLYRKELTLHWSLPNSLIKFYLPLGTNSMWGMKAKLWLPLPHCTNCGCQKGGDFLP